MKTNFNDLNWYLHFHSIDSDDELDKKKTENEKKN